MAPASFLSAVMPVGGGCCQATAQVLCSESCWTRGGSFPDAGGQLSTTVIKIVRPIMLAAGVPESQAHPHTLRHTFGRLYMAAPGAELSRLQKIMGHASPETISRYVHHAGSELAVEHRRIERLQHDPLARRQQQQQRDRSDHRST